MISERAALLIAAGLVGLVMAGLNVGLELYLNGWSCVWP